jgi:predicted aspartyl protease
MLRLIMLAFLGLALAGCASGRNAPKPDPFDPQELWSQETISRTALTNCDNRVWCVQAKVISQPGLFAVDTGSEYTLITPEYAERLGLAISSARGRFPGPNPRRQATRFAKIPYLQLGGMFYFNFYAVIVDLDQVNHAMRGHLDGILGNNVLGKTGCSFDWQNETLTLDEDVTAPPSGAVPMSTRNHRFYFSTLLNGQPAEFALDTGAYGSSITKRELIRLRVPKSKWRATAIWRVDLIEANREKEIEVTLDSFQLGQINRTRVPMMIWNNNLVGMDLLAPWVLTFDARANWMTLTSPLTSP